VSDAEPREFFVWTLFQQLVRRDFAIGLDEYSAVMVALRAGFGWGSRAEFKEVLCAIWATSREEAAVVSALFDQHVVTDWNVANANPVRGKDAQNVSSEVPAPTTGETTNTVLPHTWDNVAPAFPTPTVAAASRLPPLRVEDLPRLPYSHVFLPQYPVGYLHVAQAWRRLRWPLREGPATELDVDATVGRRARTGVGSAPVLRPRRRNQANLLLLIDRRGSMAPFHDYVNDVSTAISQAGRLGRVDVFYFHDSPLEGADLKVLRLFEGQLFPRLDPILNDVPALTHGHFFTDPDLLQPHSVRSVFSKLTNETAIVVISDGGAARGRFDPVRLLDSIASLKGLLSKSSRLVWLNPMPSSSWARSTAGHIARHVPMFPMDRDGMHRAVNVLRGQPFFVEHPLARGRHRPQPPTSAATMRSVE
jgi:uncharacterized protein